MHCVNPYLTRHRQVRKTLLAVVMLVVACTANAQQIGQQNSSCGLPKSTEEQVQEIIAAIKNAPTNGENKRAAALAIIQLQDKAKHETLVEAMDDDGNAILTRIVIAQILIHLTTVEGDMDAVPPLIHSLNKDSCLYAFMVLAHLKERAVDALVAGLDEKDDNVSRHVGWLLGIVGAPAVPPLVEKLKDDEPHVRKCAAFALGEIEDGTAVPSLVGLLKDEDGDVRASSVEALAKITSRDFGDPRGDTNAAIARWLGWWTEAGQREYGGEGK